jgi:glycosyltransferase involved in cell wall biosynthesis
MSTGKSAVIWRSSMLLGSETFIRNQGNALTSWQPTFMGATKIESAISVDTDVIAFPATAAGRRDLLRLKVTGRSARLRSVLAAIRPAVVHAHFGGDGWLISGSAASLGIPLILTVHGYDVTRLPAADGLRGIRYRRNLRVVFQRASLILAVSEFIRDKAIGLGADPRKVRVHHTGVSMPPALPAGPKAWDVLFVGRFVEKKGIDDLLEAVGALGSLRPRVLLIGTGPLEDQVRARAAELGIDATFAGAQEPAVVQQRMAESRIFVSPSKTAANGDTEGLPTTILEAASQGLPTVSTVHSGIPEAVLHGQTGLLGAEGDRQALATNIQRLLTDEALRTRLGERARGHVTAHFDLARQTLLLEELYDMVSGRTEGPQRLAEANNLR